MGNLNCKSCNCAQFFEKKTELDLKNPMPLNLDQNSDSKKPHKNNSEKINYEKLRPYARKLEALWLGYTARNFIIHLRRQTKSNHDYFSKSEIHETLSKKVGLSEFRQKKRPYKYTSGAVYTGQWLGGFRDGFGTMEWANGAKYQGNWSYSKPHGFGTFTEVDGDVYEGEWKICFVSPKDTFGTGSNLERWKDMVNDGYLWLWIKQEIFKNESPKKGKVVQSPAKSVNFEKESKRIGQVDEELQGSAKGKVSLQQSVVVKSSEKNQKMENTVDMKIKAQEVKTIHGAVDNKSKVNEFKRMNENAIESKPSNGNNSLSYELKNNRRESDSTIKKSKEEYKETKIEPIIPEIKIKIDDKPKPTPKFTEKPSQNFSMTQKSYPDQPKPDPQDTHQQKIANPPVIRFKKAPAKKDSSYISDFDYNEEDSRDSSSHQDFPSVSKRESISSSISKQTQNLPHPTIHEKDSESSSKSNFSSFDPISTMKSRIALSENSLLELKKVISDILVPKNQDPSHQFSQKKYKNGNLYIGELKGELKDGRGKMIFNGGDMYEGEWRNDKQHGRGKMIWSNGAVYIGFFDSDEKSGIGEYVWADGACYVGEWRDNLFYGYGRYRWNDGRVYNGQWEAGVRQGFGVLVDKNGNKYEGEFQNDKMHGSGVLTKSNGEAVKGVWVNGKLSAG